MEITKSINEDKLTLAPQGMIDTANAPDFDAEVELAVTETKNLEIDFSGVEYISSSGLRVLLKAQKKMAAIGQLAISHVNDAVKEVLDLTGFSNVLTII